MCCILEGLLPGQHGHHLLTGISPCIMDAMLSCVNYDCCVNSHILVDWCIQLVCWRAVQSITAQEGVHSWTGTGSAEHCDVLLGLTMSGRKALHSAQCQRNADTCCRVVWLLHLVWYEEVHRRICCSCQLATLLRLTHWLRCRLCMNAQATKASSCQCMFPSAGCCVHMLPGLLM